MHLSPARREAWIRYLDAAAVYAVLFAAVNAAAGVVYHHLGSPAPAVVVLAAVAANAALGCVLARLALASGGRDEP